MSVDDVLVSCANEHRALIDETLIIFDADWFRFYHGDAIPTHLYDLPLHGVASSATNRLITAKDHSSVQIDIGRVNEMGVLTGETDTIALCGFVRRKGLADEAFYRLAKEKGYKSQE